MFIPICLIVLGFVLLSVGADRLIDSSSKLAYYFGVPPVVVGLTIVAFGTSSPELVVSINASLSNSAGISIGNVIGSNVFNALIILGACSVIRPLMVTAQLIRTDVPFLILSTLSFVGIAYDLKITFLESVYTLALIIFYLSMQLYFTHQHKKNNQGTASIKTSHTQYFVPIQAFGVLLGLGLLVAGSEVLVRGAVQLARMFHISDTLIGLTIIAAGTSLPELITSFVATLKGEKAMAIGNVIGSNLFNVTAIIGAAGVVSPYGALNVPPELMQLDIPFLLGSTLILLPVFISGSIVGRWEGALFLCSYVFYVSYNLLITTKSPSLPSFEKFSQTILLPLLCIAVAVICYRAYTTLMPFKAKNA